MEFFAILLLIGGSKFPAARPIRSTTQIWIVMRHQYGICTLISQTSFRGWRLEMLAVSSGYEKSWKFCLVPRPLYSARTKRFGSRSPIVNTSPKWIDREGLRERRTGTRQEEIYFEAATGFLEDHKLKPSLSRKTSLHWIDFFTKGNITKMEINEKLLFRAKEVTWMWKYTRSVIIAWGTVKDLFLVALNGNLVFLSPLSLTIKIEHLLIANLFHFTDSRGHSSGLQSREGRELISYDDIWTNSWTGRSLARRDFYFLWKVKQD